MKNLLIILTILISSVSYAGGVTSDYPLYSDIWSWDYTNDDPRLKTNDGGNFGFGMDSIVESQIDEDKIRGYLFDACVKFRADYGITTPITEDPEMSKRATEHVKDGKGFRHSDSKGEYSEVISTLLWFMFSKITPEDGDINKIIADCYFDIFVSSNSHMEILLEDVPNLRFGFGLNQMGGSTAVCVQTKKW